MIYVMLAEGFEEIEALAFVDILRRANIDVQTVSADNSDTVAGSHGIIVVPDIKLKNVCEIGEGIVLPGGLPGTYNLRDNPDVIKLIEKHNKAGKYIAAICAAPSVLGKFGFLENKKATCYPSFEEELVGAVCSSERVVVDGNVVTSRGAGTAHDFAFKFVELLKGESEAYKIRSSMLYDI
ncbi:MAG: DJ-1/PfpI family protein [Clostridia bacterium]|nr:DJ-1/PfpI family protein [Clostridia bacterium]